MTKNKDIDKMEETVNMLRKDKIEDLANTASLLGSWMSDQKYTVAEQLATVELLRSSILVSYMNQAQMVGMRKFIEEHPDAKIITVDASEKAMPTKPRTIDPTRS